MSKKITEVEVVDQNALLDISKEKVTSDNVGIALAQTAHAIKNIEDVGSAMAQTAQQYTLAIEDILANEFGFTDDELKVLEKRLKVSLTTLAQLERSGFNILSMNDMKTVGEIAKTKYIRLEQNSSKKALPLTTKDFKKFLGVESGKKSKSEIKRIKIQKENK